MKDSIDIAAWITAFRHAEHNVLEAERYYGDFIGNSEHAGGIASDDLKFMEDNAVRTFGREDDCYPARWERGLNSGHPRLLFSVGDTAMLRLPSVFICGSRNASDKALGFAMKCGKIIGMYDRPVAVVSGYARGVDSAAHIGTLDGGGRTIAVLPHGHSHFSMKRLRGSYDEGDDLLVLSEMPPLSRFRRHAALRRNRLMAAMASAVIVVEPGDSGGTWYSVECARDLGKPLFFYEGERTDFVSRLEKMGGRRIETNMQAPVLDEVLRCCQAAPEG